MGGSLRPLAAMAVVALMMMMLLYLFSLQQVTDTATPKVARSVHAALERNLAPDSRTRLTVAQPSTADGLRHYVLTLEPDAGIAADQRAVRMLLRRAAELTVAELAERRQRPVVTCVARLPDTELRVTYSASMKAVPEPEPVADTASAR